MWLLSFGTGTTEDVFHAVGSLPERIVVFMSFVILGTMLVAVCFSMIADMPSGLLDLVASRDNNISKTTSSVHRNSSGHN